MKNSIENISVDLRNSKIPHIIDLSGYNVSSIEPLDYFAATLLSEQNPILFGLKNDSQVDFNSRLDIEINSEEFDKTKNNSVFESPKRDFLSIKYDEPKKTIYNFDKIDLSQLSTSNLTNQNINQIQYGQNFSNEREPINLRYVPQRRYQLEDRLFHPNYNPRTNSPSLANIYYRR